MPRFLPVEELFVGRPPMADHSREEFGYRVLWLGIYWQAVEIQPSNTLLARNVSPDGPEPPRAIARGAFPSGRPWAASATSPRNLVIIWVNAAAIPRTHLDGYHRPCQLAKFRSGTGNCAVAPFRLSMRTA